MLRSIQNSGNKPPLFFLHGLYGVMPLGSALSRVLGTDQPLYAIHASGIDGRSPVVDNVPEMVRIYVEEIEQAQPTGPILIGGMCAGCLTAIEIARDLSKKGRHFGPVILADPPSNPHGFVKRNQTIDPRLPDIADQLYQQIHQALLGYSSNPFFDLPFNFRDKDELHIATLAGVSSIVALDNYNLQPFLGGVELIISAERAASFFHPQMPWCNLLPGPRLVHVVPWTHREMFETGREYLAHLIKFILEGAMASQPIANQG